MTLLDSVINGVLLALGAFVVLVIGRFIVALANGEDLEDAAGLTGRWTGALLGGIAAAGALGLVEFADIVGMLTMLIGQHPMAVANIGIAGIGAAVISGIVEMSVEQYLGVAIGLLGITMILREVEN